MLPRDDLRKDFDDLAWRVPFDAVPVIRDRGLMLGCGTVLVRMGRNRRGEELLTLRADEERLMTLLFAVCGRPLPQDRVLHYVTRACKQWQRGDKVLAHIECAFACLPRLETKEDAYRLFLADDLLARGFTPRRLMRELGFGGALRKFDPAEPRDLSTGRWVKIGAGASAADDTRESDASTLVMPGVATAASRTSVVAATAPEIAAWLAAFAARASAVTTFLNLLVVPTPNPGGVFEGEVPTLPGVTYKFSQPTGELLITATADDGDKLVISARRHADGIFYDETGRPIARDVKAGTFLEIDDVANALRTKLGVELEREPPGGPRGPWLLDEPKICPVPSPDRGKKVRDPEQERKKKKEDRPFDELYQEYVGHIVNPEINPPLPASLAYMLPRPFGLPVSFDHCRLKTGDMIDAKGHYEGMLRYDFGRKILAEEFLRQARRQIAAVDADGGRRIEWHFYEQATLDFTRDLFVKAGIITKIALVRTKYPGNEEWPYPTEVRDTWAKGRQRE